jgi:hypothetical protein
MITREQYGEWHNHPASQFFRQFLKDRADSLIHAGTEAWLNNDITFNRDEARGRVREDLEIESLAYDTIVTFYQERENAGKDTEDGSR